ncbi:cysteine-rich PAK1 inhibitor-like isoform X2 [Ailuropoda melanoleuca]|uniref:cysteine-rich PAK1 inhibitor-like isoform X2 n=1 Tax=Ailuropoda melanoleuca TaxID=9646 RepID=UPI001493F745|nr:cysteine-rich PAK1 inhibitor-like isoform X2 [Ailuropoda melanoleuca]
MTVRGGGEVEADERCDLVLTCICACARCRRVRTHAGVHPSVYVVVMRAHTRWCASISYVVAACTHTHTHTHWCAHICVRGGHACTHTLVCVHLVRGCRVHAHARTHTGVHTSVYVVVMRAHTRWCASISYVVAACTRTHTHTHWCAHICVRGGHACTHTLVCVHLVRGCRVHAHAHAHTLVCTHLCTWWSCVHTHAGVRPSRTWLPRARARTRTHTGVHTSVYVVVMRAHTRWCASISYVVAACTRTHTHTHWCAHICVRGGHACTHTLVCVHLVRGCRVHAHAHAHAGVHTSVYVVVMRAHSRWCACAGWRRPAV